MEALISTKITAARRAKFLHFLAASGNLAISAERAKIYLLHVTVLIEHIKALAMKKIIKIAQVAGRARI